MKFTNLKIGTRLAISFGPIVLLLVALAILALQRMSVVQGHVHDITEGNDVQSALANDMLNSVNRRTIAMRDLLLSTDPAHVKAQAELIESERVRYEALRDQLDAMFAADPNAADREKSLMQQANQAEKATTPLIARTVDLITTNQDMTGAAKSLLREVDSQQEKWLISVSELVRFEKEANREAASSVAIVYRYAQTTVIAIAAIATALAVALGAFATLSITRPLKNGARGRRARGCGRPDHTPSRDVER